MKKFTSSIVAALAVSTFAFAGGDIAPVEPEVNVPEVVESTGSFYVGLGYSYMNLNHSGYDLFPGATSPSPVAESDFTADSLLLLAGYNFNQYIGIEGRYTMNIGDITYDNGAYEADYNGDLTNMAAYLKLMYPVGALNVYGLLGYGETTYEHSFYGDQSESGFQWGIGANYAFTENIGMFVDYTRMYDDTGFDTVYTPADVVVDAISVGVTYTF